MILLRNCNVINSSFLNSGKMDILIENGFIKELGENIKSLDGYIVYDLKEFVVTPGLIDIHVHLREPGFSEKETIKTATSAALKGGFTTLVAMPNTKPTICDVESFRLANSLIKKKSKLNIFQSCGISVDLKGEKCVEYLNLFNEGAKLFTDDGYTTRDINIFKKALEFSSKNDVVIMSHCEDHDESVNYLDNPTPSIIESSIVKRDIEANKGIGGKLHLTHMSSKESVVEIRRAKFDKQKVTCDVTPHHFSLDVGQIKEFNSLYKVNPPIREKKDVDFIIEAIIDGTIDIIASDHAPHEMDSKKNDYRSSSFGISGIETSFFIGYTDLVLRGKISIYRLIELYSKNPSLLLNLDLGEIKVGKKANISVFDLSKEWIVDSNEFVSKGKKTHHLMVKNCLVRQSL